MSKNIEQRKKEIEQDFEKQLQTIEKQYQEANEALEQFLEKYGERLSAYHDAIHRVSQWYENKVHNKNSINVDCGLDFGGQLGVLCLDTDEELYF